MRRAISRLIRCLFGVGLLMIAIVLGALLGVPRALAALVGFVAGVLVAAWAIGWARARRMSSRAPERLKLVHRKLDHYDLSRDDSTNGQRWPM